MVAGTQYFNHHRRSNTREHDPEPSRNVLEIIEASAAWKASVRAISLYLAAEALASVAVIRMSAIIALCAAAAWG